MPLRAYITYNKPTDEPFRQWDLETCVHCHSHLDLQDRQCQQCGHTRCSEDVQMANQIYQYRQSSQGQRQYQIIQDHEQAQADYRKNIGLCVGFCCSWVVFWIMGFLIWGSGAWFAWAASIGFTACLSSRV